MVTIQKNGKTSKGNVLYKILDLEEIKDLELIDAPQEMYFDLNPEDRNITNEEEQYKIEVLTNKLLAIWHTPQQVAEYYYQKYKAGKTREQLLASLESGLDDRYQQLKAANETIIGMDESIKEAKEHLKRAEDIIIEIREIDKEKTFLNVNGLNITENDIAAVFHQYFKGTNLENIGYDWAEIINLPNYAHCAIELSQWSDLNLLRKGKTLTELFLQLQNSYTSADNTNKKKYARVIKETEIKKWILEKGINYQHLHWAFKNNPQRIVWNYQLDNQETIPWFGEVTEIFNSRFKQNLTPVGAFSWIIGGLLGLVWVGYWFISKLKAVVGNRNRQRTTPHQD